MAKQKTEDGKGTSAVEKLQEFRSQLAAAEHAVTQAASGLDVEGAVAATARATVLRRFIDRLTVEASDELEREAAQRAREWIASQRSTGEEIARQVVEQQAKLKAMHKEFVSAIRVEAALRAQAQGTPLAADALATRFDLHDARMTVELPPIIEWSLEAQKLVGGMVKASGPAKLLPSIGMPASATAEKRRLHALRALHAWLMKSGASLPTEVQTILAEAPIPDAIVNPAPREVTPREQRRKEREAEALDVIDRDVAQARRAFDGIGGVVGNV